MRTLSTGSLKELNLPMEGIKFRSRFLPTSRKLNIKAILTYHHLLLEAMKTKKSPLSSSRGAKCESKIQVFSILSSRMICIRRLPH